MISDLINMHECTYLRCFPRSLVSNRECGIRAKDLCKADYECLESAEGSRRSVRISMNVFICKVLPVHL